MQQHVGHPALTGLAVDPHHRLVAATQVAGVDRKVGDIPHVVVAGQRLTGGDVVDGGHALLDGVLVASRECRVHEIADVGVPLGHGHAVGVLEHPAGLLDVAYVELGVDALGEQVQRDGDHVHVAGPLAVAEEGALHPVGAGHDAELGRGHRGAPVVVGMQRKHDRVPVADVAVEVLDHVAVDVGRGHLHGGGQVQDQRPFRRRADDVHHRFADLDGEVGLGAGVALGGVLEADAVTAAGLPEGAEVVHAALGAAGGDLDDAGPVGAEHHPALGNRGGVVEVHNGPGRAGHGLERAVDQFVTGLGEHLDGDVVGDQILFDELAAEVEVGLGGCREAHLDLAEAHVDEVVVHALLAGDVHRVDEGLVAVAQVDRAPQRRLGDPPVRPGPVGELHRGIGPVLSEWHGLGRGHGRSPRCGWMVAVLRWGRGSGFELRFGVRPGRAEPAPTTTNPLGRWHEGIRRAPICGARLHEKQEVGEGGHGHIR